jgi:dynein heavy chain
MPVPAVPAGISPTSGPVFGEIAMTIRGLLFQPGKVQVRFGNTEKNQVVVDGEFVDNQTICCKTANYQQFGAMPVDVRVDINGLGWTVNKMTFSYFANTGMSHTHHAVHHYAVIARSRCDGLSRFSLLCCSRL